MTKIYTTLCLTLFIGLLTANFVQGQAYIDFSRYAGGSNIEEVTNTTVINGETYLVGSTRSANFPVTNSSTYQGGIDLTITKYDNNGAVLYSTYIGGLGNDIFTSMQVVNGEVFFTGYTDSINYPVTNGSVFKGLKDIFVTKLATNGAIAFSTYLGGTGIETPAGAALQVTGNEIIIAGTTGSAGFPVTGISTYHGGISDVFISKLNATDGSILLSEIYGGNKTDNLYNASFENGDIYLVGSTFSSNLPVTIGSPVNDTLENGFVTKVNGANLSISYSRYLGGIGLDNITASKVLNGILHVSGNTYSLNYPVTNGTTASGIIYDYIDGFYTRLNSDGSILFSTYLATGDLDNFTQMLISVGDTYLTGISRSPYDAEKKLVIFKIDANGSLVYSKKLSLGFGFPPLSSFEVLNGDLYFSGISLGPAYPVTNGSQFYNGGSGFFTHLDPSGNIIFSTFLGKMSSLLPLKVSNGKFYLLGNTDLASYRVTDLSTIAGIKDNILVILRPDGTNFFSGYFGGGNDELPTGLQIDMDDVIISGKTFSFNYPVTNNILYKTNGDQFITKVSFCPTNYFLTSDTLSPKNQAVCKFGLAQKIIGEEIKVPGDSLPVIYLNGLANPQRPVGATYQWQVATLPGGPWSNIPMAIFKDYRPVLGEISQYYRRLSFALPECGSALIHISDTSVVTVNLLTAPAVDAGGPFITCPGSAINIGGSPTASGGNPPYTVYSWDSGADSVANPLVAPVVSTIYTLIVTDNLGCQQIGQATVITYRADAGPDKGACGGIAAKIGTPAITGIPGILYNWQPDINLSSTTIAQPFANPVLPTDYFLILTVPKSGGGTCDTRDTVRVTPVAAPVTPNFAGADKVLCLNDSVSIGLSGEAGFTYTWSPGSYLTENASSAVYYYPGNIVMPVPNPAPLYLTAEKNGCSFSDEIVVATIEAQAGLDGCGPRIVGLPDRTPDINETYLWTKVSGPGNLTGATNLPQVPVSASIGGTTLYNLTVTYNGYSCTDNVSVSSSCSGCFALVRVTANYLCPDYDINGGNVTLTAFSSINNAVYTWTPQEGLSSYTGSVVQLTDNVPRTYTATATDVNDSLIQCSYNIAVNDPAFSLPVFPAPDTVTCLGQPVTIGLAPVAGYSYEWTGSGLSSNLASNPVATVNIQTAFPVKVRDGNGCELKDTVVVAVQNVQANAGQDWVICGNGVVKLGTPGEPNVSYLWEPQTSPWQNGTSQFSAEPEVFVATDLQFILTATTPAGCVTKDTTNVSINNIPTLPDAPDTFVCIRNSVLIGTPALPGVTYQWTPATGLSDPGIAQPLASPTLTTTYTLVATFPGSCAATASQQVTVTVGNAFFNLPDINFCPADGAVSLGNGAPLNMVSYNWQPQQLVTNASIPNPSTLNPPPIATTVFTLTVTNTEGCSYRDTIRIIPALTPPQAGPDKLICKGQSTTIGSAGNLPGPGITYSWTPTINLSDPLSANPVFTSTTGGVFIYVLTKTNNTVSCSSQDTVIIRVIDLVPPLNPVTACLNSCVQIGTTPLPGIQYQWAPITGLSNPNIANPIACVGNTSVTYILTANDLNGCSTSSTAVVSINSGPAPQITIPAITACVGDTNIFFNPSITPPGNYSYLWSPSNGTLSNIYSLTPQVIITGAGNTQYLLQVTDTGTGCTNIAIGNIVANICPVLAVVGDLLWFDTNSDGLQNAGELGVSGINVSLYNSAGFNVGSVLTDANGVYHFIDVPPGDNYYVVFNKPAGYDFTVQNVGGPGAIDNSKVDSTGRSNNFNIPPAADISNIDAGIVASCTVPVTLLSFTAMLRDKQVLLNWQTTAEYNNHYFNVERSNGGNNFSFIGRVNGNGTTTLPHSYSLIDPHPFPGINYYRLNQVDLDGQGTYSHIVAVQINNHEIISAYYNNMNNSIQVLFNKPQDNTNLRLYGANGQLVRSVIAGNNISSYSFALPVLSKGIYMLQIRNDNFTYSNKIFINK